MPCFLPLPLLSSLLSCSFIGRLACIISDDIPCLFSFFLILQLLQYYLVPTPRFPSTCRANFFRCFNRILRIILAILCQYSCPLSIPLSITSILDLLFTFESFSFHHFIFFTSFGTFLHFVQMIIALTTILCCLATLSPTTTFVSTTSLILRLLTMM